MMIKRGEFRDEAEQNAFIAAMPPKAAKALKHHMQVAKSREFAEFDIRRGKLFLVDENRLKMPRLTGCADATACPSADGEPRRGIGRPSRI